MSKYRDLRRNLAVCCWISLLAPPVVASDDGERPSLKVIDRFEITSRGGDQVTDIRWASKDSVYLSFVYGGIVEVDLEPGLPEVRRVFPAAEEVDFRSIASMATTDSEIVATSMARLPVWKKLDGDDQVQKAAPALTTRSAIMDLDYRGDEFLVLGIPGMNWWNEAEGGLLWMGDTSKGLSDWDALVVDELFASKPGMHVNRGVARGSVRFLSTGGFIVAPGFLPGVFHYSSAGKLKHEWTPGDLWGEESEMKWKGDAHIDQEHFYDFIQSERLIDEVLVFKNLPAIVVREPRGEGGGWLLGVLDHKVSWYEVPVQSLSSQARVCGDVDSRGRMALVGSVRELHEGARYSQNELLIAELPDGFPEAQAPD